MKAENTIHRAARLWLLIFWLTICCITAAAQAPYARRVEQAEKVLSELAAAEERPADEAQRLTALRQLLPQQENVNADGADGADGRVGRVDNAWLHEALDKLADDDDEMRARQLAEIAARLTALRARVSASPPPVSSADAQRAQLERILAQPEYQPQQEQESLISQWAGKLWRQLAKILRRLFGNAEAPNATPGKTTVNVTRILILAALAAAVSFGLIKLSRRFGRKRKSERAEAVREVLGEEIAGDVTAEDLLAKAGELARHGDYRAAIRRAYIALLYELERRGKLQLHHAKTNRDYLAALGNEPQLYPSFAALTGKFERVWYGHAPAAENDFDRFIADYQETIK